MIVRPDILLPQVSLLIAQKQWKSASMLASIVVSYLTQQCKMSHSPALRQQFVEALVLNAEALAGNNETKRALAFYNAALAQAKSIQTRPTSAATSSSTSGAPSSASVNASLSMIRLKIAELYLQLNDPAKALEHLEFIDCSLGSTGTAAAGPLASNPVNGSSATTAPASSSFSASGLDRNTIVTVLMNKANCYRRRGSKDSAVEQYKLALQHNGYCMEAILGLLELNPLQASTMITNLKRVYTAPEQEWLVKWLDLQKAKSGGNYADVLQIGTDLIGDLGYNTMVMLDLAKAHNQTGNPTQAVQCFEAVCAEDSFNTDRMDIYAAVLQMSAGVKELNKLANSLLTANQNAPETWVTLAVLADKKGKHESAHRFVTKAMDICPLHARAHMLKGSLLNNDGKSSLAVKCYRRAYQLCKELPVYQGLVESYLFNNQQTEARVFAQEALEMYPENALALALTGNVCFNAKMWGKARKAYEKALSINPACMEAVTSMVELDCSENRVGDAIARLQKLVSQHRFLHTTLADLYVKRKEYAEASYHYNAAISDNPSNALAVNGLKRITKLMNGLDPSDDEDTAEDNDADDLVLDE